MNVELQGTKGQKRYSLACSSSMNGSLIFPLHEELDELPRPPRHGPFGGYFSEKLGCSHWECIIDSC